MTKDLVFATINNYMEDTAKSLQKDDIPQETKKIFFNQAFGFIEAAMRFFPEWEDPISELWESKWYDTFTDLIYGFLYTTEEGVDE